MYDKDVTVYVCAQSIFAREHWVKKFVRFFDAATVTQGIGHYEGEKEHVTLVSHLYREERPDFDLTDFHVLLNKYGCEAKQECVLVVIREVRACLHPIKN